MQYFPEIIPLFEASHYLSHRLSDDRLGRFIQNLEQSNACISDAKWTYFKKILNLEAELDELILQDPIMKRYFSPLKTKAPEASSMPLSIGAVLLSMPPELKRPFSYDSLVDFYRDAPESARLDLFYERLFPFFTDKSEKDSTMSGFIAAVNSILVDAEDKWAMIDCASNPCEHLEAMRPLVTKTMALIKEKSDSLSVFIADEMTDFCAPNHLEKRIRFIFGSAVSMENLSCTEIYPSIFVFNGVCCFSTKSRAPYIQRLIVGLYCNTMFLLRADAKDPSNHIKLLKMLSDPTRFNILHTLRHRQSFGQELAEQFGGARSATYYHLEKLLSYGLLEMEMTEYRNLYTMNKQAVYDKMNAVRDYLLDGWKPEPKQEKEEKEE